MLKEINKRQAEDRVKQDQQLEDFQIATISSIRELSSKVKVINEEVQKFKSKTRSGSEQRSGSRRISSSVPKEIGPIVGSESMIESLIKNRVKEF